MPGQLSIAMLANVTIALQRFASAVCVKFAGHVIIGTWLSVTVIVNEHVAEFPLASVKGRPFKYIFTFINS